VAVINVLVNAAMRFSYKKENIAPKNRNEIKETLLV
jgi:hypothetical protein